MIILQRSITIIWIHHHAKYIRRHIYQPNRIAPPNLHAQEALATEAHCEFSGQLRSTFIRGA
jgi:hypothetical protein